MKLKNLILILCGSFILAFGMYNFHYQNHITEGGVLGLLLLVKNVFDVSPSYTNVLIDFTLFAIGGKIFGKQFLFYSLWATCSFSMCYRLIEIFPPLLPPMNSIVLLPIIAGLFVGIGVGCVIKAGGAAGGDDVIALTFSHYFHCKLSTVYLFTDYVILILSLMVYLTLPQFISSLITVSVSSFVIDQMSKNRMSYKKEQ